MFRELALPGRHSPTSALGSGPCPLPAPLETLHEPLCLGERLGCRGQGLLPTGLCQLFPGRALAFALVSEGGAPAAEVVPQVLAASCA